LFGKAEAKRLMHLMQFTHQTETRLRILAYSQEGGRVQAVGAEPFKDLLLPWHPSVEVHGPVRRHLRGRRNMGVPENTKLALAFGEMRQGWPGHRERDCARQGVATSFHFRIRFPILSYFQRHGLFSGPDSIGPRRR
jgi:hypothetical protein